MHPEMGSLLQKPLLLPGKDSGSTVWLRLRLGDKLRAGSRALGGPPSALPCTVFCPRCILKTRAEEDFHSLPCCFPQRNFQRNSCRPAGVCASPSELCVWLARFSYTLCISLKKKNIFKATDVFSLSVALLFKSRRCPRPRSGREAAPWSSRGPRAVEGPAGEFTELGDRCL